MRSEDVHQTHRALRGYSPVQVMFLLRAVRCADLRRRYARGAGLADSRAALVRWALRSTLADCERLGVGREADGLLRAGDER